MADAVKKLPATWDGVKKRLDGQLKAYAYRNREVVNYTPEQLAAQPASFFDAWQKGIAMALRRGQSQGVVRRDLVPEETASFLIAMIEGYYVFAKNAQDAKVWNVGIRNIVGWLRSLRPPANYKRG